MAETTLNGGRGLIAGWVSTRQVGLAADTYHVGMPLKYKASVAAAYVGTGNGTVTALSADARVAPGAWTLTMTAALVFDVADPDGNNVAVGLSIADGSSTAYDINGLKFTISDGGTAYAATGVWTLTVSAAGVYVAEDDAAPDAIYNGTDGRVLAAPGTDDVIVAGEIAHAKLVDSDGDALTLTAAQIAAYRANGFYIKEA